MKLPSKKYLLIVGATVTGLTIANLAFAAPTAPSTADTVPFDHSVCDWPNRSTNPPNGCDNSEPCDGQNAANGGTGECLTTDEEIQKLCDGGAGRCEGRPDSPTAAPVEQPKQSGCKL